MSELPSEEVYKSLNIWVGNGGFGDSKNIENPVVCFKVEKSWIQDKNIDKSSIVLNRYSDKKWSSLPTSLSSEDGKYLYFTSQTPGFSPFVITGKKTTGTEAQNNPKTQGIEQNGTAANVGQMPEQKGSTKMPGFEITYCIIGLLGVFLLRRRY